MWEGVTVGNPQALNLLVMIASACSIIGALYGSYKKITGFFTKRFAEVDARFEKIDARFEKMEGRFEKMDNRFEMLENRIFELAMGKSLKDIMKEEKEGK